MDQKKKMSPELANLMSKMLESAVPKEDGVFQEVASMFAHQVKAFQEYGFTREEAIDITLNIVCSSIANGGS